MELLYWDSGLVIIYTEHGPVNKLNQEQTEGGSEDDSDRWVNTIAIVLCVRFKLCKTVKCFLQLDGVYFISLYCCVALS